jgi:hypothetical protein
MLYNIYIKVNIFFDLIDRILFRRNITREQINNKNKNKNIHYTFK